MSDPTPAPQASASEAFVPTGRAARYGKQLASHLGRKAVTQWDESTGRGSVTFSDDRGWADLVAGEEGLRMEVFVGNGSVDDLEDVLGRHLVRFGARDELVVTWVRADGSRGTEQRNADD